MQHPSAIKRFRHSRREAHSCWPYFWSCRCDFAVQSPRQTLRSSLWMHVQFVCVLCSSSRIVFRFYCLLLSPSPMVVPCWCLVRSCCLCFREDGRPTRAYHVTRVSSCFQRNVKTATPNERLETTGNAFVQNKSHKNYITKMNGWMNEK